jgi:hypothetical protein
MVNGALRPKRSLPGTRIERRGGRRRPRFMADLTEEMTTTAPAAIVRASLLSCVTVSLIALRIAAFENPMDDVPGWSCFALLPLTALALTACSPWSVFLLARAVRDGEDWYFVATRPVLIHRA